ncbi:PREDICTED: uncharacterized protein LOC105508052 [Colobus angolensis palliatus]|uniref:uncharacterized protein LOC105508052 n=1 Tax=Colobus angolensis palliatus TaxID=336983 RepID=UPI0005F49613|nr:PREDICTED: uncharacterized protein LOC105508052 [Colobus angolensis palliatus]
MSPPAANHTGPTITAGCCGTWIWRHWDFASGSCAGALLAEDSPPLGVLHASPGILCIEAASSQSCTVRILLHLFPELTWLDSAHPCTDFSPHSHPLLAFTSSGTTSSGKRSRQAVRGARVTEGRGRGSCEKLAELPQVTDAGPGSGRRGVGLEEWPRSPTAPRCLFFSCASGDSFQGLRQLPGHHGPARGTRSWGGAGAAQGRLSRRLQLGVDGDSVGFCVCFVSVLRCHSWVTLGRKVLPLARQVYRGPGVGAASALAEGRPEAPLIVVARCLAAPTVLRAAVVDSGGRALPDELLSYDCLSVIRLSDIM